MEIIKEKAIRAIVNAAIKSFASGFETRHEKELNNPLGIINMKKNNCFINALGDEFIFYSTFVRSFDSSFGNVLEDIGNAIAAFSYETREKIDSFILPEQTSHISSLVDKYEDHVISPENSHYESYYAVPPKNIESFKTTHFCDNWFYDAKTKTHFLVELKAGGDLDIKKAKSEKIALLKEYFMLKNMVASDEKVVIKFATAYNKYGEGNPWRQYSVRRYFSDDELLIGMDYWNFVCDDAQGFEIIFDEYVKASKHLKNAIEHIKEIYNS